MVFIAVGRVVQFLLALVIIRVGTSVLAPAEMGRVSLITAITSLFSLVLVNPVTMFISRRIHAWQMGGRLHRNLRMYWYYLFVVATVACGTIWVVERVGGIVLTVGMGWVVVLVGGSLVFNTVNQTYIPTLNLMEHPRWFINLTVATLILGLASSLLLTNAYGRYAEYWLLGLLLGQLLMGLIGRVVFFHLVRSSEERGFDSAQREQFVRLFSFAWPLSLSVGLNWIQSQSYRFIVQKEAGLAQLGILVTGYTIGAGVVLAVEQILTTYFHPAFYKRIATSGADAQTAAWNDYARAMFPSIIITIFAVAALAPELTFILASRHFHAASRYVIWGAIADSTRALVAAYAMVAHARMKTRVLLLPNAVGACASVVFIFFLVRGVGLLGAVIGLALAGGLALCASHWLMRSQLPISIPRKSCFMAGMCGIAISLLAYGVRLAASHLGPLLAFLATAGITGSVFLVTEWLFLKPLLSPEPTAVVLETAGIMGGGT